MSSVSPRPARRSSRCSSTSASVLDIAEQEVQAAINASGNLLPQTLPAPPIYAKVNPADAPILTLAVTSTALPLTQVEDLADTRIAQKISQLAGVGLVSITGGQRPAVRVQANLQALAAYGLNIDDLRTTIANANSNAPKGSFDGAAQSYTINANDQLQSADDYKNIVVAYKNGAPVHLSDVATSSQSAENTKLLELDEHDAGHPAQCAAPARRQRHRRWSIRIKEMLPQIKAGLPGSVDVTVLTDRTNDHPRLGLRRGVRAGAGRRAGGAGDLPVPAQPAGDVHSQPVGAAFHRRHLRGDVSAGLFAQQSVADGADHRGRLRGRRRHRDDREHLALSGGGRDAARRGA